MKRSCSPLRYPGGKAKLYPLVSKIIEKEFKKKPIYIEGFAGGFGLGIELLIQDKVESVIINDYDYCIYSFWKCVTSQKLHKKFIAKILSTDITIAEWRIQKEIHRNYKKYSMLDVGFATLFLNRTNRSGIILANPIGGINQQGNYKLDCRFNKEKIIRLIDEIYDQRKRIKVYNKDASQFIFDMDQKFDNVFFNIDPPYVKAGPQLYKNSFQESDHVLLAYMIKELKNKWILTYDDHELIRKFYQENTIKEHLLSYSLQRKVKATELMIVSKNISALSYKNL